MLGRSRSKALGEVEREGGRGGREGLVAGRRSSVVSPFLFVFLLACVPSFGFWFVIRTREEGKEGGKEGRASAAVECLCMSVNVVSSLPF